MEQEAGGHCMMGNFNILVGKLEGKRPLGRPRRRWKTNIEVDIKRLWCEDVGWIQLAEGGAQLQAFVNM
jgi:hypothetical protein